MAVQAPDGKVITFPKEMTTEQVETVMRQLYPYQKPEWEILLTVLWAIAFPVIALAVWFVGTWVLAGFKSTKSHG
jgi:hypothetical protein